MGVADRYDQMLENFFTGKYPALIQLRIAELNVNNAVDDNVGGGRAQYKYHNATEDKLLRYESDEELARLRCEEFFIKTWYGVLSPERQRVIIDKYRNRHTSWEKVAQAHHISVKTAQRYRDDFKETMQTWIK